jgi:subtilisin family serine protease
MLPEPARSAVVSAFMTRGLLLLAAAVALALGVSTRHAPPARSAGTVEVVVRLNAKPLSSGGTGSVIDRAQEAFRRALTHGVPAAYVRWRYRLVLDGLAVTVPVRDLPRLKELPGVEEVFPSARYPAAAGPAVDQIGAPQLWGPGLTSAGDGIKIGIIDDGVDQTHPFLSPSGFVMPEGFPKGQLAYTTAKVIVARAFPAPGQTAPVDRAPFDPGESHGTHVAGIAAGDAGTKALGAVVSGVAPRAYIGNYRALTVPTDSGVGKDGNAAELVAAIEAAVADGMNVINLSLGEAEIEPSRDVVALALDGAAALGVVPVVSAGNDFREFGAGSVNSPGNAAGAITVAAVSTARSDALNVVADFSSGGPTPISLRLKPDVAGPGTDVLSSIPGGWGTLSGTSMAAPHVAGGAALLRQRHPTWTVDQIKAALVETADDVWIDDNHTVPASPTRAGGGIIDLVRADQPLVFANPSSVSLGLVRAGRQASADVTLTDAGGGAGTWNVSLRATPPAGASLSAPPTVDVPGTLTLSAAAAPGAAEGDASGFIVLERGTETRRIPFWLRITRPQLEREPAARLVRTGLHEGNTRGRKSLVTTYRYPELAGAGVARPLAGPEQVFRVIFDRSVQNFGVVVVSRRPGVRVEPRIVAAGDENRLTGYPALPIVLNPYLDGLGDPVLAAGAIRPLAGSYDVVFDSLTKAGAGQFTFRFWVNDTTPPAVRLVARRVRRGLPLLLRVADRGSGVDQATVVARIDGKGRNVTFRGGDARVDTLGLAPGRHQLRFQLSDYQETRNMENVAAILPNTRRLSAVFTVVPAG